MKKFTASPKLNTTRRITASTEIPYPTSSQIDTLEKDSDDYSVENAYQDQCIDAINDGLSNCEWDSDTSGIHIFEYDEEYNEDYEVASISPDYIKELEISALRDSSNWKEFHDNLAGIFAGFY